MKLLWILYITTVAMAAPPAIIPKVQNSHKVELLNYDNENNGQGFYRYAYEQSDGTKQEQQGEIINANSENEFLNVRGSFTWIGPDGVTYTVIYVANEDGYKPEIEQGPGGAVPAGVLASLTG